MWQVEKIGIHLGKVMKEKKKNTEENKELFTFNNSVAFNTSIYKQALFMYRLRWEPSEVIPNTKEKYKTP